MIVTTTSYSRSLCGQFCINSLGRFKFSSNFAQAHFECGSKVIGYDNDFHMIIVFRVGSCSKRRCLALLLPLTRRVDHEMIITVN